MNYCLHCNIELVGTKKSNKFCCRSCSTSYNNIKSPKRTKLPVPTGIIDRSFVGTKCVYTIECVSCKTLFKTKRYRKTYCSIKCNSNSRSAVSLNTFLNNELVSHDVARKLLISLYGAKCSICGWDTPNIKTKKCPIEMDHINGNSEETIIKNVRLLCPNCHSIQPTHKFLNKGSGRKNRYNKTPS